MLDQAWTRSTVWLIHLSFIYKQKTRKELCIIHISTNRNKKTHKAVLTIYNLNYHNISIRWNKHFQLKVGIFKEYSWAQFPLVLSLSVSTSEVNFYHTGNRTIMWRIQESEHTADSSFYGERVYLKLSSWYYGTPWGQKFGSSKLRKSYVILLRKYELERIFILWAYMPGYSQPSK